MKYLSFKKSKKTQIFTVLSIVLILLMFVSFEIFSLIRERQAIRTRVASMESFLSSIEDNLERQVYISGFRILFLANSHITSTGNYINVDDFFQEAFFNGTVSGANESLLDGTTYKDMLDSMNKKAAKINVEINMTNSVLFVSQEDPWKVKVTLTSYFTMSDKSGLASWNRTQNISAYIPIESFEDPIYPVETGLPQISKRINKTIYEGNYVSGADVSNLSKHVQDGLYAANPDAPSFLKRFEGNFSSDVNGIESFVNIPNMEAQGASTVVKSSVDYIYFSSNDPFHYGVEGMPVWLRIDGEDDHVNKYQVLGLLCPALC
ncbi:MAG: hypothetical protein AABW50_02685 [Nanoarchaeota archaeon]